MTAFWLKLSSKKFRCVCPDEFLSEIDGSVKSFSFDIPPPDQLKEDGYVHENELTVRAGGKKLSQEEVSAKISSFESFKELLIQEDSSNSSFDWSKVIDSVIHYSSVNGLSELLNIERIGTYKEVNLFAALSKVALHLKEIGLAEKFAEKALQSSAAVGWQRYYDGGTRLIAFNAYQEISPSTAKELGFKVFTDDVLQSKFPGSYVEHLEHILPLITSELDVARTWNIIEGHLNRLMDNEPTTITPPTFETTSECFSLCSNLLLYLSKHKVTLIHKIAKEVIVRNLHQSATLQKLVRTLSTGDEENKELFVEIMLMLSFHNQSLLLSFEKEIKSLYPSSNFFIHTNTEKLLKSYNKHQKYFDRKYKSLHFIYSLELVIPHSLTSDKPIDAHGYVKNTENPLELIKPFGIWLDILSKKSGLSKANIAHRWKSIMQELSVPFKLSSEYEEQIRIHLKEIDFNQSYPRPRVVIAQRALMHLVSELCDAGSLIQADMEALLRFYDYSIDFLVTPIVKPAFIKSLSNGEGHSLSKSWMDQANHYSRLKEELVNYEHGWVLIGEYTLQRNLDWGLPSQTYMMNISFDSKQGLTDKFEIFGSTFGKTMESYYEIEGFPGNPNIIVINDSVFYNFDLKTKWIAFNTNLAYFLGWIPDSTNLFGWKDKYGNPMVKSIFWLNGNLQMNPPKLQSEAGEGWVVIITEKGLNSLKKVNSCFKIEKRVIRTRNSDGRLDKQYSDTAITHVSA